MISVGIDVSKGKSMVIFMSEYGEVLLGPKEYFHNDESLNQLHNEINKVSSHYTVIMESTSVYHKKPESFFKSKNQEVIITNPLLAALSKRTLRRTKTDKLDCEYLANTYFENNFTKQRDDNVIAQLQSQSRLIDSITKNISKTKNIFLMKLTLCFPSLELLFSKKSLYTNGMLEFISKNPHPDYLIRKQAKTIRKELSGGKTKGSGSYLNASLKIYKERNKLLPIVEKNSIECHVLSCYAKQLKQLQELYDEEKEIYKFDIHTAGAANPEDFFRDDSVVYSSVRRAKGNETFMVYIVNAQKCVNSLRRRSDRNGLFTAITRSKGWVRVLGFGEDMKVLNQEFEEIKKHDFKLYFDEYPDKEKQKEIFLNNQDVADKDVKTLGTTKILIDKLTGEGSASKLQLMQELFGMSREELLAELTKQTGDE